MNPLFAPPGSLSAMYQQSLSNILGGLNEQHWAANQTLYSYSAYANHPGNLGATAHQLAALQTFRNAQQTPPPPEPIEDAGIIAGEVIGWRCWRVRSGYLQSMSASAVWTPDEAMQGKPSEYAGVHAWKSQSKALEYAFDYSIDRVIAVGRVALWGEIIEHEDGFRAEFAAVDSIEDVIGSRWLRRRILSRLRRKYVHNATTLLTSNPKQSCG